jgi:putative methyltransferase (TIGR04325 family)
MQQKGPRSHPGRSWFRRLVVGALPVGLIDPIRERRRLAREEAAAAKVRAISWADAAARARGYDDAGLCRFLVARAALGRADGICLRASVLGLVAKVIGRDDLVVTDFGGGTGGLRQDFLRAYPRSTYTVVEQSALVALMGDGFTTAMPPACDVFYSSGTLQYLEDPLAVLAAGAASARLAVVLRKNNFADREMFDIQFSRLFDHGSGPVPESFVDSEITYPRRTLVESEVMAVVEGAGFRCIASLDEAPVAGGHHGRQLVFLRG